MDIDDALAEVGGYRRWHLAVFSYISLAACIPLALMGTNIVFIGHIPPHHCHAPPWVDGNASIPLDPKTGQPSSCSMYVNQSVNNQTRSCAHGWDYRTEGETSIVMEWDLVCDNNYLSDLTQVIYQLGGMVGDIVGAPITDYFGRKWVHASSYIIVAVFGVGLGFSQNYTTFIIIRFFISIAVSAGVGAGFLMVMEIFDSKRRAFAGIILEVFWVTAYFLMALLGWLIRDWRHLQIACAVVSVFGIFAFAIPESPLWLEANHRVDEAEEILQKMARYNGVKTQGPLLYEKNREKLMEKQEGNKKTKRRSFRRSSTTPKDPPERESILDLVRDPLLRKFTIISSALWFCNNLVFYFMILSSGIIPGGRFFNFFLGGIAEIPAVFFSYYVVRYSRRVFTCVMHLCAGVCLIFIAFIPVKTASGTDLAVLIMCIALLGKFFISCSFNVIILYTRELYPTNLRACSSSVVVFLGRLGNMGAPFASYLGRSNAWIINVSLGILSLVVAMATLLLPETKDWLFPQCIEDVYTFTRGRSRARSHFVAPDENSLKDNHA